MASNVEAAVGVSCLGLGSFLKFSASGSVPCIVPDLDTVPRLSVVSVVVRAADDETGKDGFLP